MNLGNFLTQINDLTAQYSEEQLAGFVREIGRILPEDQRETFLRILKAAGTDADALALENETTGIDLDSAYDQVKDYLKRIAAQEVQVTCMLNEEYDDWYDDEAEECFYEDHAGVSNMLAEVCDFVHTCMDRQRYEEGSEVGRQMLATFIFCECEYGDEMLTISDMAEHQLLQRDIKDVILDILYCTYCAQSIENRAEALYEVLNNGSSYAIRLEDLMQHGESALPDFPAFLSQWITFLGERTGRIADKGMKEAVTMVEDLSTAVSYAREFSAMHPGLYADILKRSTADAEVSISLGLEAMKRIPKQYKVRSRIALQTAENILNKDADPALLEQCWLEAFASDTVGVHYLRALLSARDPEKMRKGLRDIIRNYNTGTRKYDTQYDYFATLTDKDINQPSRNTLLLLSFLDGQFKEVLADGLHMRNALGWTGTFMKQGIAVYLLCLYEGSWMEIRKDKCACDGIKAMANMVKEMLHFSVVDYQKGLLPSSEKIEEDVLFCQLFQRWKTLVPMDSETKSAVLEAIERLLEKRVQGIMSANRRNYYGECAAYLAAIGEVRESRGENGGKQRFMMLYKECYSRRSSFCSALRSYGWIDTGKKR